MMKVKYSPRALEDLQKIRASIVEKFDSEKLAEKTLRKIMASIEVLEVFPYKGVELKSIIDVDTDYRYIFGQKNYVFYRIADEKVLIIRVLNEKQDYMRILWGISEVEDDEE